MSLDKFAGPPHLPPRPKRILSTRRGNRRRDVRVTCPCNCGASIIFRHSTHATFGAQAGAR